ncbi:MAG: SDR family NAD(P)-dependent oxidoreductase [Nocardioidaceae bacterium]
MELVGRLAVVTGAGSGLGYLVARRLADEGAHVVVGDVDRQQAQEAVRDIEGAGGRAAWAIDVDMSEPDSVHRFCEEVVDRAPPAVLVNNAGGWGDGPQYPDADEQAWRRVMELNLLGPMLATQLLLEPMRAAGGGVIVNVASVAGTENSAYGSPTYATAKAGLVRLTTSLAGLRDSHRVRAGCVVPGWIGLERAVAELASMSPAERAAADPLVRPERVVDAVLDVVHDRQLGTVVELVGDQTRVLHVAG